MDVFKWAVTVASEFSLKLSQSKTQHGIFVPVYVSMINHLFKQRNQDFILRGHPKTTLTRLGK